MGLSDRGTNAATSSSPNVGCCSEKLIASVTSGWDWMALSISRDKPNGRPLDQLLGAAEDEQAAIFIDPPDVSGAQPAVGKMIGTDSPEAYFVMTLGPCRWISPSVPASTSRPAASAMRISAPVELPTEPAFAVAVAAGRADRGGRFGHSIVLEQGNAKRLSYGAMAEAGKGAEEDRMNRNEPHRGARPLAL